CQAVPAQTTVRLEYPAVRLWAAAPSMCCEACAATLTAVFVVPAFLIVYCFPVSPDTGGSVTVRPPFAVVAMMIESLAVAWLLSVTDVTGGRARVAIAADLSVLS